MGNWWKIAGVIIFIYVLIGGLAVPLKTGITLVAPSNVRAGAKAVVEVHAYNSHFTSSKKNYAWLKKDDKNYLQAISILSKSEQKLQIEFQIPADMVQQSYTLLLYNDIDGVSILPDGIYVEAFKGGIVDRPSASVFQADPGIVFEKNKNLAFPYRSILNETIRNIFFHVALWMAMFVLYVIALYHAINYLKTRDLRSDMWSLAFNKSGILFGVLGIATGSLWAKYTWGSWWTNDVKLNMATIAMFIYFGYLILRASFNDDEKKARISAVFSIFAFVALIPLVFVIPRLTDSLHPGNGGNPALGGEDLDHTLRLFFYPSVIALILIGSWMAQLQFRYLRLLRWKMLADNGEVEKL